MNFSLNAQSRSRRRSVQQKQIQKRIEESKPFLQITNGVQLNHTLAGFFSCSNIRLRAIIDYVNNKSELPQIVDSSRQYKWYKNNEGDITFQYFKHYNEVQTIIDIYKTPIQISFDNKEDQFSDYRLLNYDILTQYMQKYFSPSIEIENIGKRIENKYNIDYNNTVVVFYRGLDKSQETKVVSYESYLEQVNNILIYEPHLKVLIQSDESEFLEYMESALQDKCFYLKDEIQHTTKSDVVIPLVMKENKDVFSKNFLAIIILMSKCKYIVCGSGNCSLWIMYYRGNANNVYQQLQEDWLVHEYKENITYCKDELMPEGVFV